MLKTAKIPTGQTLENFDFAFQPAIERSRIETLAADPLATVMERKLTRLRVKHAQTREYMEVNALRSIVKDGAGATLYDYFTEFGLARLETDFVLGTATTQVQAKIRDVLRKVETELKGETMAGVLALVSPEFFDKLIGHAKVEEAYKYYSSTGAQPLREDTRRRFPFGGIVFEEMNATVTLANGATETLIPAGEGIALRGALLAWLAPPYEPCHGRGRLPCQARRRPQARRPGQTERNESDRNNRRLSATAALVPTMLEIRYLLARLLLRPPTGTFFIIGWSLWRRQHQLKAAIAHYKCRANAQL